MPAPRPPRTGSGAKWDGSRARPRRRARYRWSPHGRSKTARTRCCPVLHSGRGWTSACRPHPDAPEVEQRGPPGARGKQHQRGKQRRDVTHLQRGKRLRRVESRRKATRRCSRPRRRASPSYACSIRARRAASARRPILTSSAVAVANRSRTPACIAENGRNVHSASPSSIRLTPYPAFADTPRRRHTCEAARSCCLPRARAASSLAGRCSACNRRPHYARHAVLKATGRGRSQGLLFGQRCTATIASTRRRSSSGASRTTCSSVFDGGAPLMTCGARRAARAALARRRN